ncbi:GyrI-like domain-containing protein [Rubinisphaera sp. ICM_H10]|nr:GyrI-like domain-containing protein [Rubinisphaera margarita]MCG6157774.1 GyrI-like domain-containing protein [Rubinisphaera margarita]
MKVMVIVKASPESEAGEMPSEQLLTEMGNFNEELVNAGVMEFGEGLHPSSRGKRIEFSGKERIVIDGPFAETKELIAGFWIWNVKSMDEAVEWAKKCPNPHESGGTLEIRSFYTAEDFGEVFTPEAREQEASLRAQMMGLGPVRFERSGDLKIVGLQKSYTAESRNQIPQLWQQFAPSIGQIPGQQGMVAYGVCLHAKPDCSFDYLAGVGVEKNANVADEQASVELPDRRYVVFEHTEHVSKLPEAIETIWSKWIPESGLNVSTDAPCFERYTEEYDPEAGQGGTEIWIPLVE